jgi:hypothetical protein
MPDAVQGVIDAGAEQKIHKIGTKGAYRLVARYFVGLVVNAVGNTGRKRTKPASVSNYDSLQARFRPGQDTTGKIDRPLRMRKP